MNDYVFEIFGIKIFGSLHPPGIFWDTSFRVWIQGNKILLKFLYLSWISRIIFRFDNIIIREGSVISFSKNKKICRGKIGIIKFREGFLYRFSFTGTTSSSPSLFRLFPRVSSSWPVAELSYGRGGPPPRTTSGDLGSPPCWPFPRFASRAFNPFECCALPSREGKVSRLRTKLSAIISAMTTLKLFPTTINNNQTR